MAKQCKECSCVVDDEQALNTHDEFGFVLCGKCVRGYLNDEKPEQQSGQVTSQEPSVDPVDECIILGDNKPSVDQVKYPTKRNNSVANEIKRTQSVSIPVYTREQIETIKNTVANGATDSELQMFMHVAQTYGLDPFLKEIYYSNQSLLS